jgi:GNAT superfamily N-acetyltransferase|tara:strand:- start:6507 stop:6854 length:348 start_codon:yes stop_codon:yes gene_type:complete
MKRVHLFEAYIQEAMELQHLEMEYGIDLDLWNAGTHLELSRIIIPKAKRGQGIGTQVMQQIISHANQLNLPIFLTASKDFGATSISRLTRFYKDLGFQKNQDKGKSKLQLVKQPD